MRRTKRMLPIIFGIRGYSDKCCVIGKHEFLRGFSFYICWLKHTVNYGDTIDVENIDNAACHLHFTDIQAARAFRDSANKLVEMFEKEGVEK